MITFCVTAVLRSFHTLRDDYVLCDGGIKVISHILRDDYVLCDVGIKVISHSPR